MYAAAALLPLATFGALVPAGTRVGAHASAHPSPHASASAPAGAHPSSHARTHASAPPSTHTLGPMLERSKELWATVNMCNPPDKPDQLGIRGSMPGDGHTRDVMYMRFALQYMETATKQWAAIGDGGYSGFLRAGAGGASARQLGRTFQLAVTPGRPTMTLRGVVTFQWRRRGQVLYSTYRVSTADHISAAGADPPGYSAASCAMP